MLKIKCHYASTHTNIKDEVFCLTTNKIGVQFTNYICMQVAFEEDTKQ